MELLLLVFFCLLTGSEVTFGAENGTTVIRVKEGKDVTLPCSLREDITNKKFVWKKDGRQVFLYDDGYHSNNAGTGQDQLFRGRVSYFLDKLKSGIASITIRNMTVAETGLYTCEFPDLQPSQIFRIVLVVDRATGGPDEVRDELNKRTKVITVKVGKDVTLPCSLRQDITNKKFEWMKDGRQVFLYDAGNYSNNVGTGQDQQFKGRVEHFPDKLKSGDASITIRNMKVTDRGDYTCEFPDLQPRQIFYIFLFVDRATGGGKQHYEIRGYSDRDIAAAVIVPLLVVGFVGLAVHKRWYRIMSCCRNAEAKPSVRILRQTKFSALLQCEVRGAFPKPELHWEDNDGNKLPADELQESKRGRRYDITLKTTVTKNGNYRCVATQEKINHQTQDDIDVDIIAPTPSVKIIERTHGRAVLQCEVRGASLKPDLEWKDSDGKKLPAEEPQETEREGLYDIILKTIVTKTSRYHCVATYGGNNHQPYANIDVDISEPAATTAPTAPTALTTPTAPTPPEPAATTTSAKGSAQDGNGTDGGDVEAGLPLMPLNGNQTPNEDSRF